MFKVWKLSTFFSSSYPHFSQIFIGTTVLGFFAYSSVSSHPKVKIFFFQIRQPVFFFISISWKEKAFSSNESLQDSCEFLGINNEKIMTSKVV
uniref:Uncharacterized protein n=1 Tax=Tetranychus urticae TaxID=32264 RepID=T1KFL9_TETUR